MAGKGWSNPGSQSLLNENNDISQVRYRCIKSKLEARAERAKATNEFVFILLHFNVFLILLRLFALYFALTGFVVFCTDRPVRKIIVIISQYRIDNLGNIEGNANYHGGKRALRFQPDG